MYAYFSNQVEGGRGRDGGQEIPRIGYSKTLAEDSTWAKADHAIQAKPAIAASAVVPIAHVIYMTCIAAPEQA